MSFSSGTFVDLDGDPVWNALRMSFELSCHIKERLGKATVLMFYMGVVAVLLAADLGAGDTLLVDAAVVTMFIPYCLSLGAVLVAVAADMAAYFLTCVLVNAGLVARPPVRLCRGGISTSPKKGTGTRRSRGRRALGAVARRR